MTTHVESKVLGVLDPHQVSSVMKSAPTSIGGYPTPGPQTLTVTSAMNKDCFVDENTWKLIAENGEFDDIVVGSGFCGLAYIDEALRLNPFRKILLLERGGFWLPDHFQNLPLPFEFVAQGVSETFPWELTSETVKQKIHLSGSSPFFGGRSSFWSIWSPRAIGDLIGDESDLMDNFPLFMKDIARNPDFYKGVDRLLHVQRADKIADPVFKSALQKRFDHYLSTGLGYIPGAQSVEPARLATGVPVGRPTTGFRQFSTVGPLLAINGRQNRLARQNPPAGRPIMIATDVVVERFEVDPESGPGTRAHARVLHTSRGPLTLRGGNTNVILAAGPIPNATILLNSLNETFGNRAGKRLTAHFRSNIKARFKPTRSWLGQDSLPIGNPAQAVVENDLPKEPAISACHVRGRDSNNLQWHIQVNGSYAPVGYQTAGSEKEKAELSSRLFAGLAPDNGDPLTPEQAENSEGCIIVSCSVLGEQPPDEHSWVKLNKSDGPDHDVTTNIRLQLNLPDNAKGLWETMEDSAFKVIEAIAAHRDGELEYWNREDRKWEPRLGTEPHGWHIRRVKPLFHEASTTFMTESFTPLNADGASVDKTYRPFGLEKGNVYVTGAGLFPTAGSWNPTPTIVGFAQHLAKTLVVPPKRVAVFTQEQPVPTTKTRGLPDIIGFNTNGSVSFWSFSGQKPTPPASLPSIFPADFTNIPLAARDVLLADLLDILPTDLPDILSADVPANVHGIDPAPLHLGNILPAGILPADPVRANQVRANLLKIFAYRNDRHVRLLADTTGHGLYDLVVFNETGVYVAIKSNQTKQNKFHDFRKKTADFTFSSGWRVDKHIRYMVDTRKTGRADIIGFGDLGVILSKNEPIPGITDTASRAAARAAFAAGNSALDVGANAVVAALNDNALNDADALGIADGAANALMGDAAAAAKAALAAGRAAAAATAAGTAEDAAAAALAIAAAGNAGAAALISGVSAAAAAAAGAAADAVPKFQFTSPSIVLHDLGYDQGWRLDKHLRFLVDFCGSGFPDIIGFGETSVAFVRNNHNGSFGARRDFDLGQFTYSSGWRVDKHVRTLADMSGKGRPDIVGFGNEGVYVAVNKGDGTVGPATLVLKEFGYNQGWRVERDLRMIVDVNGSGLGDIVGFGRSGVYISNNKGNGRFDPPKLVARDFGYLQGWMIEKHQRFMVDVTGNGCADIVGFGETEVYVAFNNGAGEFWPAQKFANDFSWRNGWNPSNAVRYVARLD